MKTNIGSQMGNSCQIAHCKRFTLGFYFQTVTCLLGSPKQFFNERVKDASFGQALGFLLISSLFFTIAVISGSLYVKPLMMGVIFFINAVGMAFIAAALGYIVMGMFVGRKVTFALVFNIYAFASGLTLLVSWMPFFMYLTEPWKWWLIGTGMVKGCDLTIKQSLVVIGISILMLILTFWSLIPVMAQLRSVKL